MSAEALAELAPAPPPPPPALGAGARKGKGARPSFLPEHIVPTVRIESTTEVPSLDGTSADQTLLDAKKVAEKLRGTQQYEIVGRSIVKGAEIVTSKPLAPPKEGEGEAKAEPAPALKVLRRVPEPKKVVAPKGDAAVEALDGTAPKKAGEDDETLFTELVTAVEEKTKASPIKVKPSENIFVPVNRRSIFNFIVNTYRSYVLKKPVQKGPNFDACKSLARVSDSDITNFAYQEFVRDYMQRDSPYRGILVYHGLGSGKTCTSIAAIEGLRYGGSRKIYIITPAALSSNYRKELSICGYYAFRKENHWEKVEVPVRSENEKELDDATSQYVFLTDTYGLDAEYIENEWKKKHKRHFWVAQPNAPQNYTTLAVHEQKEVTDQIETHMRARFEFIHYNGLLERKVREWACADKNRFDGSVIVIDEVHNFVNTISLSRVDAFYKDEPRISNYKGLFCQQAGKYRIAYLMYRLLCNAVGCKVIALSGTPLINRPHEIGILSNILSGDRRAVKIPLSPSANQKQVEEIVKRHPEVDFYEFASAKTAEGETVQQLLLTPVPSFNMKIIDETTGDFKGFVYRPEGDPDMRERDIEGWYGRIKEAIGAPNIAGENNFVVYPQLPDIEKDFIDAYVNKEKLQIHNQIPLKQRLTGLISYYRGSKRELVAKVIINKKEYCDMSEWQLSRYLAIRKEEMSQEKQPIAGAGAAGAAGAGAGYGFTLFERDLYTQATKSVSSSFKVFSRAACNFVFPDGIERPTPSDAKKAAALLGIREEADDEEKPATEREDLAAAQIIEETHNTRANALREEGTGATEEEKEEQKIADAATEILDAPIKKVQLDMQAAVEACLTKLREQSEVLFGDRLGEFSPKFVKLLANLKASKGPALVYSNFKTLEGLNIFSIVCDAQKDPGYVRLNIVKKGGEWALSDELLDPANKNKLRYILYTGDDDPYKREILRNIFNWDIAKLPESLKTGDNLTILANRNPNNQQGKIVRMFMITQSGAEGISLKNVRQVHIMEPFWNYVRIEQVQGRAIRICSHKDLPLAERTVEIYKYVTRFSDSQKRDKVDPGIATRDKMLTTDEIIDTLMETKKKLSDMMFKIMQESAIDCTLNTLEHNTVDPADARPETQSLQNGTLSCFFVKSSGSGFLYHPDYLVDNQTGEQTFRAQEQAPAPLAVAEPAPAPMAEAEAVAEPAPAPMAEAVAEPAPAPRAEAEAVAEPAPAPLAEEKAVAGPTGINLRINEAPLNEGGLVLGRGNAPEEKPRIRFS